MTLLIAAMCMTAVPAVDLLGHARFRVREAAHRCLCELGPLAATTLWASRSHRDPEVRRRVRQLTGAQCEERIQALAARLLPTGYPRLPWLQLNDHTENAWLEAARRRWGLSTGPEVGWPEYRRATQLRVESWLREGRTEADIVADLDRMRDEEVSWIAANGAKHSPPITMPDGHKE